MRRSQFPFLVASFLSAFDRGALAPILIAVAASFEVPVEEIVPGLVVYGIGYAASQLVWARLSDRFGRVRILVVSTALGGVAALVCALAADPWMVVLGRGLSAAGFGGTVASVITYFGDTLPLKPRLAASANVSTMTALGFVVGTFGTALMTEFLGWRSVFFVVTAVGALTSLMLLRVPEAPRRTVGGLWTSIAAVLRSPWPLAILALGVIEGFAMLGVFNYLPTAVQHAGGSLVVAGAVTAVYGVAVIIGGQLLRFIMHWLRPWQLIGLGGLLAAAGFLLVGIGNSIPTAIVAAALIGFAWAFSHTSFQTWMSDAAWQARATGIALFAMVIFAGGAFGSSGAALLPGGVDDVEALFVIGAVTSAVFGLAAAWGRRVYRPHDPD